MYFTFTKALFGPDSTAGSKSKNEVSKKSNHFDVNESYSRTPDLNSFYRQLSIRGNFNHNIFLSDKIEEQHISLMPNISRRDLLELRTTIIN